jgi:opacity protein-like surface antigen
MKKLLAASLLAFGGTGAIAQSAFEGFYGQAGVGYENNSVSSSSSFTANGDSLSTPTASNGIGQINLGLGYNASVTKQFLLGVGAEYSTISSEFQSGQITSATGCGTDCRSTQKYKVSNRYSIFLTPGYAIDKDKLAYLKAGYSSQTVQASLNQTSAIDSDNGFNFGSKSVGGYILGLGYKQIITGGFYGFGEANYYSYSSASLNNSPSPQGVVYANNSTKSDAYSFLIGVGYKF